jgi:hypothetical protein
MADKPKEVIIATDIELSKKKDGPSIEGCTWRFDVTSLTRAQLLTLAKRALIIAAQAKGRTEWRKEDKEDAPRFDPSTWKEKEFVASDLIGRQTTVDPKVKVERASKALKGLTPEQLEAVLALAGITLEQ